jgi:hypothetical protein
MKFKVRVEITGRVKALIASMLSLVLTHFASTSLHLQNYRRLSTLYGNGIEKGNVCYAYLPDVPNRASGQNKAFQDRRCSHETVRISSFKVSSFSAHLFTSTFI